MTAVPIHAPASSPNAPSQASNPSRPGPQAPGSPQADPGTSGKPEPQPQPQTDSLDDIRNDLDHYPGGLTEPDPQDQQLLANAVPQNPDGTPQRFPDPFGPWSQLQNDGGNEVPGRSNNCADCSRSFLETWRGNPQVSAPRTLDTDENGNLDPWSPESEANENQIRWSGAPHSYAGEGSDPDTAQRIADDLLQAGHGAHAIVQVDWPGGGGHAFNAVNHNGQVVWIDTQSGEVSHDPLHIPNAEHVWHIPMDPDGNPLHPAETDTEDSQKQNDEPQPDNSENPENPENPENNGQPDNNTQNDASGNTPKQPDGTEMGTGSPKAADSTTSDKSNASNTPDTAQPSATDATTAPDPANGKIENESGRPSPPDSTPDGRQPSPDDSNTAAQPQQSPSPETPTNTTANRTDKTTPDNSSTPARTASDSPATHPDHNAPSHPTPNRDTPQQTTTPSDPRTTIPHQQTDGPRTTDPRATDPRATDPRTSDPRTSDPRRDAPTQKKPESDERPDGQRPDTSPGPDQTQPDDSNHSPAGDHRDRPSSMNKDAAVPTRESLPDGKNADAAGYVKDSTNGKQPLYGPIADDRTANPPRPAQPAGSNPNTNASNSHDPERDRAIVRRQIERANDPNDSFFEDNYNVIGSRREKKGKDDEGNPLPQLRKHPDTGKWVAAKDAPPPLTPDYKALAPVIGKRQEGEKRLEDLDKATKRRADAIDRNRKDKAAKKAAEEKHGEDSAEYKKAEADYKAAAQEQTKAGEHHGEAAAALHAMPDNYPDPERKDDGKEGNNRFDQVWKCADGTWVVVEAKAPTADLGDRRSYTGRQVMQGHREYFETILRIMEDRSPEEALLADDLRRALKAGKLDYVLVQSKENKENKEEYGGYEMTHFDITPKSS